jgi:hypothetical protein
MMKMLRSMDSRGVKHDGAAAELAIIRLQVRQFGIRRLTSAPMLLNHADMAGAKC